MTPEERLPFYIQMADGWKRQAVQFGFADRDNTDQKWPLIEAAVLKGL
jgi:hypothetical protein